MNSLKLSLQAATVRHGAIASNVANVNTPGYHRRDLSTSFQASLKDALHNLDQGQQIDMNGDSAAKPAITIQDVQNAPRFDGNTVNIDQEMTEMMKNQADFDFSARLLTLKYSGIKQAIGGNI